MRSLLKSTLGLAAIIAIAVSTSLTGRAETVSIVIASNAAPRVKFGAEKLVEALQAVGTKSLITTKRISAQTKSGRVIALMKDSSLPKEGYELVVGCLDAVAVVGGDDSGLLYASLELSQQIRKQGKLPVELKLKGSPAMTLRGTCVGLQKTYILPGRKVYEYPYTPELFPDRKSVV